MKSWHRETLESFQPLPKRGKLITIKNHESVKSFNNSSYLQREREASQVGIDSVWETYDQKGPWHNFRGSKLTQIDNKTFFQRDYDSNAKKLAKTNSQGKSQTGTSRNSHFFSKSQSHHKHAPPMKTQEILFDKPDIYHTLKTDNKKHFSPQPNSKKGYTQSQILPVLSTVNLSGNFDPTTNQNISTIKNDWAQSKNKNSSHNHSSSLVFNQQKSPKGGSTIIKDKGRQFSMSRINNTNNDAYEKYNKGNSDNHYGYISRVSMNEYQSENSFEEECSKIPTSQREFFNEELRTRLTAMAEKNKSKASYANGIGQLKNEFSHRKKIVKLKQYKKDVEDGKFQITAHYDSNIFKKLNMNTQRTPGGVLNSNRGSIVNLQRIIPGN